MPFSVGTAKYLMNKFKKNKTLIHFKLKKREKEM
jgi:hypothetical protein